MTGLTKGTRLSYRIKGEIRHGTLVAIKHDRLVGGFYRIRNDASGLVVNVLPQQIVAVY